MAPCFVQLISGARPGSPILPSQQLPWACPAFPETTVSRQSQVAKACVSSPHTQLGVGWAVYVGNCLLRVFNAGRSVQPKPQQVCVSRAQCFMTKTALDRSSACYLLYDFCPPLPFTAPLCTHLQSRGIGLNSWRFFPL